MTINGENVENMPHQDVVKKLRQLNEDEANDSITLCIMRQEVKFIDKHCQVLHH